MEYQDTASSIDRKFTFSETEIQAVQAGLSLGLYNAEEDRSVRQGKWRTLFGNMCQAFGMEGYHLEFTGDSDRGAGAYDRGNKTVYMGSRFSLTTLLHHFLLALCDHRREDATFNAMIQATGMSGRELIAAFSLSLFREAAPEMYEKAKTEGKLIYFVQQAEREEQQERRRRQQSVCPDCGCEDCECQETCEDCGDNLDDCSCNTEPLPGATIPDIDPENRVDQGNGPGED